MVLKIYVDNLLYLQSKETIIKDFTHEGLTAMKISTCNKQLENETIFMKQMFSNCGQQAMCRSVVPKRRRKWSPTIALVYCLGSVSRSKTVKQEIKRGWSSHWVEEIDHIANQRYVNVQMLAIWFQSLCTEGIQWKLIKNFTWSRFRTSLSSTMQITTSWDLKALFPIASSIAFNFLCKWIYRYVNASSKQKCKPNKSVMNATFINSLWFQWELFL